MVAEGLAARIECLVRGNRPIGVVWRKNSIVIEHSPRLVLQTVLDANSSVLSAELKIERSERSDTGKYFCFVSNKYGRDEVSISLHVKGSLHSCFFKPNFSFLVILDQSYYDQHMHSLLHVLLPHSHHFLSIRFHSLLIIALLNSIFTPLSTHSIFRVIVFI